MNIEYIDAIIAAQNKYAQTLSSIDNMSKSVCERMNIKVVNTIDNPRNSSRQFFLSKSDCEFLNIKYVNGLEVFAL